MGVPPRAAVCVHEHGTWGCLHSIYVRLPCVCMTLSTFIRGTNVSPRMHGAHVSPLMHGAHVSPCMHGAHMYATMHAPAQQQTGRPSGCSMAGPACGCSTAAHRHTAEWPASCLSWLATWRPTQCLLDPALSLTPFSGLVSHLSWSTKDPLQQLQHPPHRSCYSRCSAYLLQPLLGGRHSA